ncbi:MAG: M64 family metallopeptidase [Acidobacteriia bacterium]|nr:M64 family metallopeptidase [Terriglobia bacterium]
MRGEQPHPVGTHVNLDVQTTLQRHVGTDPRQITQPSAVQHPLTGRTHVARATFDGSAGRTMIHTSSATHPTILAHVTTSSFDRAVVIDSAVVLTHFNGELLLAWQEGGVLKCCSSADGASWSPVRDLAPLPAGERFALWSEGSKLYLASTQAAASQIVIRESADAATWTTQFPVPGLPGCLNMNPWCLAAPISALAIATTGDFVFMAYGEPGRIKVARFRKGPVNFNLRSLVISVARQQTSPAAALHALALHPSSTYGWTLAFVESYADATSSTGRRFVTRARRSDDGLEWGGTEWQYASGTTNTGGVSLVTTGVPMPWIIRMHDSGRPSDAVYNFVIVTEGFTYAERDRAYAMCQEMMVNVMNRAPFFYNKDLFNFWAVITYSKDSGWSDPTATPPLETIFGSTRVSNQLVPGILPMPHAWLLLTGNRTVAHYYGWALFNGVVATRPYDDAGASLCEAHLHSIPGIHEYLHTVTGGFNLGDHDLHDNRFKIINKTFDGTFSSTGAHAWQDWFVFGTTPTASRKIPVTDAYRTGLLAWVNAGNTPGSYAGFPYSTDPTSPSYVDALSLFQVGLWESELPDIADLAADPMFTALRACLMNSQDHHSHALCPICSRVIVEHLHTVAGMPFVLRDYQNTPKAFLEFQSRNQRACGTSTRPDALDLNGLVVVNGHPIAASEFMTYQADTLELVYVSRMDLTPWVTVGTPATIEFKRRSLGETRIWIPGIQVLNGRGARYSTQPVDIILPSGESLVTRLHDKHPTSRSVLNALGCDYEYWDLAEGDFALRFMPH